METGIVSKRPKSRKQHKATNGSAESVQRENPEPGGELQLVPKQKCIILVQRKWMSH